MAPDDVGATDSRLRHVGLWMPTRFAEAGLGLEEEHEPTLERERGVRCHDHVPKNWRAHDEGVDFVGAACFSSTQCDLVDAPCALLYQLMWTSKGEVDASGPTACEIAPRRSRPLWTPNVSVARSGSSADEKRAHGELARSSRSGRRASTRTNGSRTSGRSSLTNERLTALATRWSSTVIHAIHGASSVLRRGVRSVRSVRRGEEGVGGVVLGAHTQAPHAHVRQTQTDPDRHRTDIGQT